MTNEKLAAQNGRPAKPEPKLKANRLRRVSILFRLNDLICFATPEKSPADRSPIRR